MKDKSNIYNLSKEAFDEIKKNEKYWEDIYPGAKKFADFILKDIEEKELPYTMSIEGRFGSGKTHFATRFCEYIKEKGIESVYISAFEHDYNDRPIICIANAVYKALNKIPKEITEECKGIFTKFLKSASLNIPFLDIKLEAFFSETDPIQEFKQSLSEQIKKEKGERLVLIIDELDRCRPDFAVRLLEVLKHIFNVDGIFVILIFNNDSLTQSLKKIYGLAYEDNNESEHYIDKFINCRLAMHAPSEHEYEKLISSFLEENGIQIEEKLIEIISRILLRYNLSLRQAKNACENIAEYYNPNNPDIKLELFTHLVCKKILNRYRLERISIVPDIQHIDSNYVEYKKGSFDDKRKEIWDSLVSSIKNKSATELLRKYGLYLYYDQDFDSINYSIIKLAKLLYKSEGKAAYQFAASYISEFFDEVKKIDDENV